ncbi:MAG TPA: DNA N-6-adenine-methyltransferase [Sedimentisphaerales bacterium]|nr:DNA N-6-adenine-methyltransferase [Sedimentisphaerales bacterium]
MGGHHSTAKTTGTEWITPPWLIDLLGPFDTDPCACPGQKIKTATTMITSGGLEAEWRGRVWLNPPYGNQVGAWLERLANHYAGGIALVFARTETRFFHEQVWNEAAAIYFFQGRLHFHHRDGSRAKGNAGAPSCLVAYGKRSARVLKLASDVIVTKPRLRGKFIWLRP